MVFRSPVSSSTFINFQYFFLAMCLAASKKNQGSVVSLNPFSLLLKGK